jgi:hypothetical protein
MTPTKNLSLLMVSALLASATSAGDFQADRERIERKQAELEQACEDARQVKLEPLRVRAFNECMNADRSTDTAEDCRRKTAGLNANRQNGSPRFYDLPACVEAFEHRKAHPKTS